MALRFYSEFSTSRGNDWRVNIYDSDFSGTAAESNVGAPGFALEYSGGADVFSPLMPSTCTVYLAVQSAQEQLLLTDLSDFIEGRFTVEVRYDPDGADTRHWIGMLSPESIRIPDEARPFIVQLQAVCGLSVLSRKDYDVTQQQQDATQGSYIDHLTNCLRAIPNHSTDFFANSSNFVLMLPDIVPETGVSGDTLAQDVFFGAEVYDPELGLRQVGTYEDMLVQLLTLANSRLFMWEGVWMVQPVSRIMNASTVVSGINRYDRLNNFLGSTSDTINVSIDQSNRHRTDGEFYFLPAIRKVSRRIDYFGNAPFAGSRQLYPNFFYNTGNAGTDYSIGYSISGSADVDLEATQKLRVKGFAFIQQPFHWGYYFDGSANYDPQAAVMRWKVSLKVKVGDRYLKRVIPQLFTSTTIADADIYDGPGYSSGDVNIFNVGEPHPYVWSTDPTARVEIWSDIVINGHVDAYDDPVTTRLDFDFLSPSLGSEQAATVDVEMDCTAYNGEATAGNPDAYISGPGVNSAATFCIGDLAAYLGDGSDSGDVITYGATVDNGATEELELEVGIYSEGTSDDAYNFSAAALKDSSGDLIPGFSSDTTAASTPAAELLCIDRLHFLGEQQECWQGTIQSGQVLTPFSVLLFDSKKWMVQQLTYSAAEDLYDIDCIKVKLLGTLDPDSFDPVRRSIEPGIGAAGGAGVLQESIGRQAATLSSEIADIVTDVDAKFSTGLSELGDVNLSALSNLQVLQYSSGAGEWRNADPTDNSLSQADQDIAAGTTRKIVLNGGAANQVFLIVEDGQGNVLESIAAYGNGIVIQEKYGALAVRSSTLFQGSLALYEAAGNGINSISIKAPAAVSSNKTFTLPDSYGTSGQHLTTDGAGTLSWAASSGGGGSAPIVLANISGRFMFSSSDSGERMWTGQGSYGPFNWYSFTSEPGTTMRTYSAADAVGSKTGVMNHWQLMAYGVHVPTTDKKVRVDFMMRMQNPPASSTWGFSLWGANRTTTGTTTTSITTTLRGISTDVTAVDTNSTRLYHGYVETDADFTEDVVILMPENRTGTLTTTTYLLCNFQFTLVD